jgi:NAD(P)-dependent dehydrogenase (short-subunit alcohol dehydrogenase family)
MIETGMIKKVLITGGTSGLGLELVKLFLAGGAEVFATGRKMPQILSDNSGFHFIQVDFSDLKQVEAVISQVASSQPEFDLVINNAGVLSPHDFALSKDGFEYTFQVNVLAHLLLDDIIVRSMQEGNDLRIAFVTSPVYKYVKPLFIFPQKNNYNPFKTYCETKYNLLLVGSFLKLKYPDKDLKIIGLDPGIFSSGIYRMQKRWFHKMYSVGALFMRSSAKVAGELHRILNDGKFAETRVYFRSGKRSQPFPQMSEAAEKFMAACHDAVKIKG